MNTQDKTTAIIQQRIVNDLVYRLGLLIDDLQFTYATAKPNQPAPSQPADPGDENDGVPWDDDIPFG